MGHQGWVDFWHGARIEEELAAVNSANRSVMAALKERGIRLTSRPQPIHTLRHIGGSSPT
jgi:hypothetical protein